MSTKSPVRASRSPTASVTFCSLPSFTRQAEALSPSRTSAVAGIVRLGVRLGLDAAFGIEARELRLLLARRNPPALRPGAWSRWRRDSRAAPCPRIPGRRSRSRGSAPVCPAFTAPTWSADTMPSKRMLLGSITLSSSLPICAVSPAETLRSLTMPSKGARTSVRCSCWRACTTRVLAASRSLCAVLRRTSASSSCLGRGHARGAQRLHALELPLGLLEGLAGGAAGGLGRGERVADRGVVQAHQQVAATHGVAVLLAAPAARSPGPRRAGRRAARAAPSR